MIKCTLKDGTARYFSEHAISSINTTAEGELGVVYTTVSGEAGWLAIQDFMLVKPGVRIK